MGYYNYRVTGNAFRLPYLEHSAQYDVAPPLLVQAPYPEPVYRHTALHDFHVDFEYGRYFSQNNDRGEWLRQVLTKLEGWWRLYLGYGLSLSALALPSVLRRSPRTRFAFVACLVLFGVVATLEVFGAPHYVAPAAGLLYLVVVQGFRWMYLWRWRGKRVGRGIVVVWLTACLLAPVARALPQLHAHLPTEGGDASRLPAWLAGELRAWLDHPPAPEWAALRADLEQRARKDGGKYLLVIDYKPDYSYHQEWVYNEADIDGSPVVWARAMGGDGIRRLAAYFPDRTILLLKVGVNGLEPAQKLRDPVPGHRRMSGGR
jgi:hypothetical protein